jgi:hypothetical protein
MALEPYCAVGDLPCAPVHHPDLGRWPKWEAAAAGQVAERQYKSSNREECDP